jgi:hypothetical protein
MEQSKILLVYDFTSQPFSIGDILCFQEMGLCICKERGYSEIDFVFTYSPRNPVIRVPAFHHINKENFQSHLPWLIPVGEVSQLVTSVKVLTHEQYGGLPKEGYQVWPPKLGMEYKFYEIMKHIMKHFEKYGSIPHLSCKPELLKWAKDFGGDYVSIQLRRNPRNSKRDSKYIAWRDFMKSHPEQKFIIVCDRSEVDERLRMPNVVFANDHLVNSAEGMALIQASRFHMGASSGPCVMCMFRDKPYVLYNSQRAQDSAEGIRYNGSKAFYPYSKPFQWNRIDRETPELLLQDFMAMEAACLA